MNSYARKPMDEETRTLLHQVHQELVVNRQLRESAPSSPASDTPASRTMWDHVSRALVVAFLAFIASWVWLTHETTTRLEANMFTKTEAADMERRIESTHPSVREYQSLQDRVLRLENPGP